MRSKVSEMLIVPIALLVGMMFGVLALSSKHDFGVLPILGTVALIIFYGYLIKKLVCRENE